MASSIPDWATRIEVCERMIRPTSETEIQGCLGLATAIDNIASIADVHLFAKTDDEPVLVSAALHGRIKLEDWWGRWLWIRVFTDRLSLAWAGRLSAHEGRNKRIFIAPRPNLVDPALAENATRELPLPKVTRVDLGVIYGPRQTIRIFDRLNS